MSNVERRIPLAGPLNFRDIGGYPTEDGNERVRWRKVFRSDSLFRVTEEDAERIAGELGLLTIIDMRTDGEIERFGRGALEAAAIEYRNIPIIDETQRSDPAFFVENTLEGMYLIMVRQHGAQLAEVLNVLADDASHPVVFHCAAGKDRTGLVAALLLTVLGVSEDDVVEDYALTTEILPQMRDRWLEYARAQGIEDGFPPHAFLAEAETMRAVLRVISEEYGSPLDYLRTSGVDDASMDRLRAALLEPA